MTFYDFTIAGEDGVRTSIAGLEPMRECAELVAAVLLEEIPARRFPAHVEVYISGGQLKQALCSVDLLARQHDGPHVLGHVELAVAVAALEDDTDYAVSWGDL